MLPPFFSSPIIGPFLAALAIALATVPLSRFVARQFGFVARPREDRWHRKPVALMGGVGMAAAVFATVPLFMVPEETVVILACAGLVFLLGLLDDVLSLKPATKLVAQIAIAAVLIFFRYRLNWSDSLTFDMLFTLVWIVGLTNAFNLLDNMDGLCAGIALIVAMALMVSLAPAEAGTLGFEKTVVLAALAGATTGFLVYNFHPASIFMGDSGSLLLGFTLAAFTLAPGQAIPGLADPLTIVAAPVLVLLIPIFDTTLVTVSRIFSGRSPAAGGKDHSSHRLVAMGLSERHAVMLLWALAAAAGTVGLGLDYFSVSWSGLIAVFFLLGMLLFAVYLGGIRVYHDAPGTANERFTPLVTDLVYKRRVAEVVLDFCLVTIAYYAAYRLRFEGPDFTVNFSSFYRSLPIVLAVQMLAFFWAGIYRGVWRQFGLMDTVTVAKGVLAGALAIQLAILYLFRFESYSRSVFVIYSVLLAIVVTASRASFRLMGEFLNRRRELGTRVLIYGAGDGGSLVVRELLKHESGYRILGFIDDDPQKQRTRVQGFGVLGSYEKLAAMVADGLVDSVVVSARVIDARKLQALEALCAEHGVAPLRLHVGLEQIRPVVVRSGRADDVQRRDVS